MMRIRHLIRALLASVALLPATIPCQAAVEQHADPVMDGTSSETAHGGTWQLRSDFPELIGPRPGEIARAYQWLDQPQGGADGATVGYRWNRFRFERTATADAAPDDRARLAEIQKVRSRFSRLSFRPAENLTLQLARGRISGLDYLVADESLRRTALSATYFTRISDVTLESTLAWGRSSRKLRESTSGFLMESTAYLGGGHALFGRVERVGSDELVRDNEGFRRQWFTLNRLAAGYFQEFQSGPGIRVQAGAFVTRYLVPSSYSPAYGEGPTTYMMFVRFKLR